MIVPQVTLLSILLGMAVAQMPTYLSTKYAFPTSSGISTATLQSLLAKQLYSPAVPRRTLAPVPVAPTPRYGLQAASNPSLVAIPLYVRNQAAAAKNRAFIELLSNAEKKAASNKYLSYTPKKEQVSVPRYERPTYVSYAKYDQPKAAPSSYEPVRSYELKQAEPGYGDASSVSLLSGNYGQGSGSISVSYPPSSYKQSQQPRLKAVEYDDSQKSALVDFASALENFDLKQISSQDIYDLPSINPPLSRLPSKQESRGEDSYGGSTGYAKSQTYEAPAKASYAPAPASAAPSYDDAPRSSYSSASSGQSYSAPEYAASSESYRPESYRPKEVSYVRSSYSERPVSSSSDSYRSSGTDSYGSSALYVPAPASYDSSSSYSSASSSAPETSYSVRPAASPPSSSSYGSSSSDYYSSAPVANPDDPNCPYKTAHASASNQDSYASPSQDYAEAPAPSTSSSSYPSSSYAKESSQGYGDELDPSKLELKIVHLPVSVLRRLVGNGELSLPSFNKKK
jgi:hypothetical protein